MTLTKKITMNFEQFFKEVFNGEGCSIHITKEDDQSIKIAITSIDQGNGKPYTFEALFTTQMFDSIEKEFLMEMTLAGRDSSLNDLKS